MSAQGPQVYSRGGDSVPKVDRGRDHSPGNTTTQSELEDLGPCVCFKRGALQCLSAFDGAA